MLSSKHFSQLDGLRAFAVVSVMIGHWIGWDSQSKFVQSVPWGHGVVLFFVLSGYLITQILLFQKDGIDSNTNSIRSSLWAFYSRRFLRIFPIYYLLIFYLYYIDFDRTREYFPWLVTYTSNLYMTFQGETMGDFVHFWSLAIEEQFYLVWPLLIFLTPRKWTLHLIIGSAILSFISRLICVLLYKYADTNWMWNTYFTPNLILPLALGAFLAYIKHDPRFSRLHERLSGIWLLYGSIILYIVLHYVCQVKNKTPFYGELFDEYLFAVACFFIILRASENGFRFIGKQILEHDVITFTGKISYGLYVYHLFVIGFFWNYISPVFNVHVGSKPMAWTIYFIIGFLMAIASYFIIEKPISNLKKYFRY